VRQFHLQTIWPALGAGANEHSGYWPALGVHCHRAVIVKAVAYGLISSYQITPGRVHGSELVTGRPAGDLRLLVRRQSERTLSNPCGCRPGRLSSPGPSRSSCPWGYFYDEPPYWRTTDNRSWALARDLPARKLSFG
jgi:hypothetical protein